MPHRLKVTGTAKKELKHLPGHVRQRARRIVSALADNPRPREAKELRAMPGRYRIRLDKWRIIYRVDDEAQEVLLLRVRRKEPDVFHLDVDSPLYEDMEEILRREKQGQVKLYPHKEVWND